MFVPQLLALLLLAPATSHALSPVVIGAQLSSMRARPRRSASVVEANTREAVDGHTQVTDAGGSHGSALEGGHAAEHGDGVKFDYCVESHEVHEQHGIRVATWRWAEVQTYYAITLFIVIAGLAKLAFHHAHFLSSKLPESCLLIILGVFMGVITYHIRHRLDGTKDETRFQFANGSRLEECEDEFAGFFPKFDAELFFLVLLPPIVLEASYSLHDRAFMDNLGSVLIFAVVGTLFNMFIIGPALYGLAMVGAMGSSMIPADSYDISQISLVQMLTFSSLIVAVDPVAVLAIFQEVGVNKDLYFLVFGESLLNDAVTVVLYNAMVVFANSEDVPITYDQVLLAVTAFLCVSLGGLLIGIVFGVLTAIITKYTPDVRVVEPLSLLAMAYLAYLSAELVHFSGIIATVGCGVVQAHYAMKNISKNSYITIKYFITMASSTSDTIIFMFLGMVLVSDDHKWHTGFALWTLVLCLVVRFVGVYLLCWLANFRRLRRIGKKEQFIMAYGGLRGAVGFSLVVMLRDSEIDHTTVRIFVTTTLFIILFTVFIQGSTIKLLVSLFNIKLEETDDPTMAEEIASTTVDHITAGVEEIIGYRGTNFFKERLEHFDEKYLKPLLISDTFDSALARLYDKLVLDEHYANLYGPAAAEETKKIGDITGHGEGDFFLPEEDMVHLRRRHEAMRRQTSLQGPTHPLSRLGTLRDRLTRRISSASLTPGQTSTSDVERGSGTAPGTPMSGRFNPDDNYMTYPHAGQMLRKAFRSNPYNKLHFKYNPNLIDEEDQEIDSHMRRRRMNAQRFSQLAQRASMQDGEGQLRRTASGTSWQRATPPAARPRSVSLYGRRRGRAGRRAQEDRLALPRFPKLQKPPALPVIHSGVNIAVGDDFAAAVGDTLRGLDNAAFVADQGEVETRETTFSLPTGEEGDLVGSAESDPLPGAATVSPASGPVPSCDPPPGPAVSDAVAPRPSGAGVAGRPRRFAPPERSATVGEIGGPAAGRSRLPLLHALQRARHAVLDRQRSLDLGGADTGSVHSGVSSPAFGSLVSLVGRGTPLGSWDDVRRPLCLPCAVQRYGVVVDRPVPRRLCCNCIGRRTRGWLDGARSPPSSRPSSQPSSPRPPSHPHPHPPPVSSGEQAEQEEANRQ